MKRLLAVLVVLLCPQSSSAPAQSPRKSGQTIVGGGCDGCEAMYIGMPKQMKESAAKGYYQPGKGQTGQARRHGHLRGWMKTNQKGEYKFRTIKPAPYPNARIPAHIHPVIKEPELFLA